MPAENIVEVHHLKKSVGQGEHELSILTGVELVVKRAETIALIGESGSGKSTLLAILAGLDDGTDGDVNLVGKPLHQMDEEARAQLRAQHVGFVFQSYNLVNELTGYENIILPIMLDKKKVDEKYIDKIISMLGIEDRLSHLPSALSGGQQQRIAIARALANKPSILFADEPTGNLDKKSGQEVLSLLKYCAKEFGITLILVTHDLHVAEQADRILTIEDGKIIADTKAVAEN